LTDIQSISIRKFLRSCVASYQRGTRDNKDPMRQVAEVDNKAIILVISGIQEALSNVLLGLAGQQKHAASATNR